MRASRAMLAQRPRQRVRPCALHALLERPNRLPAPPLAMNAGQAKRVFLRQVVVQTVPWGRTPTLLVFPVFRVPKVRKAFEPQALRPKPAGNVPMAIGLPLGLQAALSAQREGMQLTGRTLLTAWLATRVNPPTLKTPAAQLAPQEKSAPPLEPRAWTALRESFRALQHSVKIAQWGNTTASTARARVHRVMQGVLPKQWVSTGASIAPTDNILMTLNRGASPVPRALSLHLQLEALTSAPSVERASMESTKGLPLTTLVLTVPRVRRMLWKDKTSASTVLLEPRLDRQVW